jgi:phosphoribosylaminoimidazolecarboxamide formyltransferase/IMP cyclohydrolase
MAAYGIEAIDLVVVSLYPFEANPSVDLIDIGGPALLRAAAKNHQDVLVVVDPARYDEVLAALRDSRVTLALRRTLAAAAFAHTAGYDARIARYLNANDPLPPDLTLSLPQAQQLRYGENPHQRAVLYGEFARYFASIHGRELSAINIMDIAAATALLSEFDPDNGVALTIVKHTNPCGVASAPTALQAWQAAFATDREAPFGGVIALNQPLDLPVAQAIDDIFSEIVDGWRNR